MSHSRDLGLRVKSTTARLLFPVEVGLRIKTLHYTAFGSLTFSSFGEAINVPLSFLTAVARAIEYRMSAALFSPLPTASPPAPELAKVVVKGLEADSVILRKELFRGQHGIGVVYTLFL